MPLTPSQQEVQEGPACPACTGPLRDVVTAACGHTYCQLCLPQPAQMGVQPSARVLFCSFCQDPEHTRPMAAPTVAPMPLGPLGEACCKEHGEKIYFFCGTDAELLCVLCQEGPAHQTHSVGFLEEAIQPYRDQLRSRLAALSLEKDKIENMKCQEDQKLQTLLTHIENKKQQVEAAFERLQQELEEQRYLLLATLRELEQQIWKERNEYVTKVLEEVARLGAQVEELEEKCQQPASELLQDVRVNQSRCEMETFVSPVAISSELVKKIRDLHRKILALPEVLRMFSENLGHHLETDSGVVTLDPQTASRNLVVSEDRKSVRYTRQKQSLPDSSLRFGGLPVVLGAPGFSAGRHRWQVEVRLGARGGCTLGVAAEEVQWEGERGLSADRGVWAVILSHQRWWASTSPGTDLPLCEVPRAVAIALDYEAGRVAVLNADTRAPIFTFTASFSGRVFPFFAVWKKGSSLTLTASGGAGKSGVAESSGPSICPGPSMCAGPSTCPGPSMCPREASGAEIADS